MIGTGSDLLAEPDYRSAAELVAALASRRVSSVELVDAAIARIGAIDRRINAVVIRDFERARSAAAAADAGLARGKRAALLGLPMTVKESFNVEGLPTSWGNPRFKDWRPEADSLAVARLRAAGAVILGKTNVAFMLADWQSHNEVYGTTNNPWDLTRTPGGSSGGAAAALAAGFVALELGTDIGGSLRAPAHYCGVYSHKPSRDLVPMRGAGPPASPAWPVHLDLPVVGPMARSTADLAIALDVLSGPDEWSDGVGYQLTLPGARHDDLASYRVLAICEHPLFPTAKSVRSALDDLLARLARAGAKVSYASPALPDLAETARIYVQLLAAFHAADLPETDYQAAQAAARALSPEDQSLRACRVRGVSSAHRDWLRANRAQSRLREGWRRLFEQIDIVLCPAMPTPAFPHDHMTKQGARKLDVDGEALPYGDQIVWASIATLLGLPATVAPIGHSKTGLLIGVQIIGPFLEDRTTLGFASLIEREFGGFVAPPLAPRSAAG